MSDTKKPPTQDRLEKFRAMAGEAKEAARNANTQSMRSEYQNLVHAWEQLIGEIERLDARDVLADGSNSLPTERIGGKRAVDN